MSDEYLTNWQTLVADPKHPAWQKIKEAYQRLEREELAQEFRQAVDDELARQKGGQ